MRTHSKQLDTDQSQDLVFDRIPFLLFEGEVEYSVFGRRSMTGYPRLTSLFIEGNFKEKTDGRKPFIVYENTNQPVPLGGFGGIRRLESSPILPEEIPEIS